jgi:hypothetical protein
MELLPSEILFGIVKYLGNWEVKQLSLPIPCRQTFIMGRGKQTRRELRFCNE